MIFQRSKKSRLSHSSLPILLLASILSRSLHAEQASFPVHFEISQTLETSGEYSAQTAVDCAILDGRMRISQSGIADPVRPEIDTFHLCITPVSSLSLHAGSITVSGLPARASNPLFPVSSPFYSPLEDTSGATFGAGTSRRTEKAAAEFRYGPWRVAAYTARIDSPAEPTWLLVSHGFRSFSKEDEYLKLAFFSGNRRTVRATETSWFTDDPETPDNELFITGAELIAREGAIGGSCTGFFDTANSRESSGIVRSEVFFDTGSFLATGGFYCADRNFITLSGCKGDVLSRIFFAPRFFPLPLFFPAARLFDGKKVEIGTILYQDTRRGDKFYHENRSTAGGGAGFKVSGDMADFAFQGIRTVESVTLALTSRIRKVVVKQLQASFSGKTVFPGDKIFWYTPGSTTLAGTLIHELPLGRQKKLKTRLGYKGTFKPDNDTSEQEVTVGLETSFSPRHSRLSAKITATFSDTGKMSKGSLTLTANIP